jgi:ABC-2 type transport system permease protein
MKSVLTLALKDLRLLARNQVALFWILAFPLMFALFFGSIMGGGGQGAGALPVAILDEDQTDGSRAFVKRLQQSEALKVSEPDRAAAQEAVRRGGLVAFVVVPKGFGESAGFFGPTSAKLQVGLDPSRRAEAGYLQGVLLEAVYAGVQEQFTDPKKTREQVRKAEEAIDKAADLPPEQQKLLKHFFGELTQFVEKADAQGLRGGPQMQPAKIEELPVTPEETGPHSAYEISFPSSILWGILGCVQSFIISLVSERVGGTFLRLRIAPLTRGQILAGKGLACFLACAGVAVVLLLVGWLLLGVRITNPAVLVLAVGCTALCFVGIMMLLCTLGKTVEGVSGAAWGILMPLAMLGGGMIPLIAMPAWMLTASHFSPVKWGIYALEGAIWRGFSLAEMLLPCGILVGVGAACFAAGVRVLARE